MKGCNNTNYIPVPGSQEEVLHQTRLERTFTTNTVYHLHLHHKDSVRISVVAENGARLKTEVISNGYLVDLTRPRVIYLHDGLDKNKDQMYTVSVFLTGS